MLPFLSRQNALSAEGEFNSTKSEFYSTACEWKPTEGEFNSTVGDFHSAEASRNPTEAFSKPQVHEFHFTSNEPKVHTACIQSCGA
jgi:hypothetical protein